MRAARTFISLTWSIQRGDHGEQPIWAGIALAAMLGQIGLPGGGFGIGYGCTNYVGVRGPRIAWPSLPQGKNPVRRLHSRRANQRHAAEPRRSPSTTTGKSSPIPTCGSSIGPAAIPSITTRI